MLDLVERAQPGLSGPDSGRWLKEFETYHDDIRAALQFALDNGDHDTALRLAVAAAPFWLGYGHANEGRAWLEQALADGAGGASESRIHGLVWLADLAFFGRRDSTRGLEACAEAIDLAAADGNLTAEAMALASLGNILTHLGRGEEARAPLARAIELSRQLGAFDTLADALTYLGALEGWSGRYAEANRLLKEARSLQRDLGEPCGRSGRSRCSASWPRNRRTTTKSQKWHRGGVGDRRGDQRSPLHRQTFRLSRPLPSRTRRSRCGRPLRRAIPGRLTPVRRSRRNLLLPRRPRRDCPPARRSRGCSEASGGEHSSHSRGHRRLQPAHRSPPPWRRSPAGRRSRDGSQPRVGVAAACRASQRRRQHLAGAGRTRRAGDSPKRITSERCSCSRCRRPIEPTSAYRYRHMSDRSATTLSNEATSPSTSPPTTRPGSGAEGVTRPVIESLVGSRGGAAGSDGSFVRASTNIHRRCYQATSGKP